MASSAAASAPSAFRLPTDIVPTLYKLRIQASPKQDDFQGRVRVFLRRNASTPVETLLSEIRCNVGPELTVTHARVFVLESEADAESESNELLVSETQVDAVTQILTMKLAQSFPLAQLDKGEKRILVDMVYQGRLNEDMAGLYRSEGIGSSEEGGILLTQFESVSARRCFPCWDEPALKAVFELELLTPPDYTVLSNTEETQRLAAANNPWIAHRFAPTPLMSSYLVAFVIGKLECIERVAPKSNVRVRCWARQDGNHAVKTADFALDVACKCLDLYAEWFDIPFPLPKCDLIAIEAFSSGAMENWACITFRDTSLLLYDESNDTSRRWIATTVSQTHIER
jgi:aminopeptidase N